MALDARALIEDFVTVVQPKISGVVIISDQSDAPRPDKVSDPEGFTACKVLSLTEIGRPEYARVDAEGLQEVSIQGQLNIDIQAFGPNALGRLSNLKLELKKSTVRGELYTACLALVSISAILDISTTLDTEWEERAQMAATFNLKTKITDNISVIETVILTENLADETGTVVRTLENSITI